MCAWFLTGVGVIRKLAHAFPRRSRALSLACVAALAPFGVVAQTTPREHLGGSAALPQARFLMSKPGDTLSRLVATARSTSRNDASPSSQGWVTGILERQQLFEREQSAGQRRARPAAGLVAARRAVASLPPAGSDTPLPSDHRKHLVLVQSGIEGSFLQALLSGGVPEPLAHDLIRVLGHELDLQRELRPGDHFSVLFERYRADTGGFLRDGKVLHATFRVSGRDLAIWRHDTADGPEWFDGDGRSLRRDFLRTPLDGARITSGFGMRQHPVLGFTRMHQGVDFAAPTGTPVVAAADGTVMDVGPRSTYGRTITLRHSGGTETLYAHLSSFSPGLAPGQHVRQGQTIGRVGSTGLSSGPHLHYEITQGGRQVNPATVRSGGVTRLAGSDLAAFHATQQQVQAWLGRIQPMQELAMAD
jgi:murein DD-endopeptidase MepM/ murein hydrolase activator NlpD